ncbi:MAG TPA: YkgJ family cysteine cluster protein [Acidiferrobacterales bacterium]|nr:YkgJ family cysteine cluster protein [Acidiferrobacterales bacterium]
MDKLTNLISESPFAGSPVMPELLEGDKVIQFQCRKGIDCWNACCSNIDISLTPVDILRLSRRLGISTTEFLMQYTFPYELEPNGIAGVKFKPVENGSACQFMRPEGCDVYSDRPTACRYYPVALLSMRRSDEYTDRNAYALVKEPHCHGHNEPRQLTIEEYRQEQGIVEYDELGRGWRQLVLKKKSSGPVVGTPSKRSLQLWFLACYDLDRFRDFIASTAFNEAYDIPWDEMQKILSTDDELMLFAFRFLRQTMFGEEGIKMKADAFDKRLARKKERDAASGDSSE